MKQRNPLSAILSLLVLVGAVVVVGLMFGGVIGTDPDLGDKQAGGLDRGIKEAPPVAEGRDEPLGSLVEEEVAREAITPVENAPGPAVYVVLDPGEEPVAGASCRLGGMSLTPVPPTGCGLDGGGLPPHPSGSREHLDYYLDEFTFRFNRRSSRHRGTLFHRLLEHAVAIDPVPYATMVQGLEALGRSATTRGRGYWSQGHTPLPAIRARPGPLEWRDQPQR